MESCPSINCFLNEQFKFIFCFAAVLCVFVLSMTAISIQNYCKLRRLSPEGRMKARIITNRCETFIQSQLEISSKDKILRLVWNLFNIQNFSVHLSIINSIYSKDLSFEKTGSSIKIGTGSWSLIEKFIYYFKLRISDGCRLHTAPFSFRTKWLWISQCEEDASHFMNL